MNIIEVMLNILYDMQEKGHAAIHAAVESGNIEIVEYLISIFPDTRDTEDRVCYFSVKIYHYPMCTEWRQACRFG